MPNKGMIMFEANNESCVDVLDRLILRGYESELRYGLSIRGKALDILRNKVITITKGNYSIEEILRKISNESSVPYRIENHRIEFSIR